MLLRRRCATKGCQDTPIVGRLCVTCAAARNTDPWKA